MLSTLTSLIELPLSESKSKLGSPLSVLMWLIELLPRRRLSRLGSPLNVLMSLREVFLRSRCSSLVSSLNEMVVSATFRSSNTSREALNKTGVVSWYETTGEL